MQTVPLMVVSMSMWPKFLGLTCGIHTCTHTALCQLPWQEVYLEPRGLSGCVSSSVFTHQLKEGVLAGSRPAPVGEIGQAWERNIKLDLISASSLADHDRWPRAVTARWGS